MRHVHLECLQTWTHNHRKFSDGEYVRSYHWRKLQCELCRCNLTTEFEIDGHTYKLLDYRDVDQDNHLILESISSTAGKTLHLINVPNLQAKKNRRLEYLVGRVSTLDIRVTDPSVSRVHSKITYYNGDFYIKDLDSKFGTMVWLRYPIPLPKKLGFKIACQVKEAYFEIGLRPDICKC
jgi:hypothetical protein